MDRKRGRSVGRLGGSSAEGWLLAAVVGAALFAYLGTCARAVLGGDNGEFLAIATRGGVAHPPGYPLFTLYLRAMAWTPGATVAESLARANALVAAGAVLGAWLAARAWGASSAAATVGACAWAALPLTWKTAVHAEVFALNALLGALVLAASGPDAPVRGARRLVLLGLVSGLGLANHPTIVFLMPVGIAGVVRAFKEERARWRGALVALAVFAGAIVAPYAWLVGESRRAAGWTWRGPMSAADMARHFVRADYWTPRSGAVDTVLREPGLQLPGWERLNEQLGSIVEGVPWVVCALAGVGAARLALRSRARLAIEGSAIAATFALAGPWGNALHVLKPVGIGRVIVERFYVLPQLVLCVAAACGVHAVLARVERRVAAAAIVCAALAARGALFVAPEVREHTRPTVELYVKNTLRGAPRDAIVVGSGDHRFYGFLYAQDVLGMRPDVTYVDFVLLGASWYRARVGRLIGASLPPPDAPPIPEALVATLLATGRPVLVASHAERLPARYARYPWGTVRRVVGPGEVEPDPITVEELNLRLFERMDREAQKPADKWSWAGDADETYDAAWLDLAKTFEAFGMREKADECMRRVR